MNDKFDMVRIRLTEDRTYLSDKPIRTPDDAVEIVVNELKDIDRECFIVINIDTKGKPINANIASIGDISSSVAHPREIFKSSILSNAAGIILMHNHPSGELTPSAADIKTTQRIKYCGDLMGITVLDHIVFTPNGKYMSMVRTGLMEADTNLEDMLTAKVKEEEFTYENDENSGLRIYRKIDGKGVYIRLNDAEMWEAYRMEMYRGYEKYISENLADRKGETVCGMKAEDILSDPNLIGAITQQYEKEITYSTADDSILEAAYQNVIPGYIAANKVEERINEEIEYDDIAKENGWDKNFNEDKLLEDMLSLVSKAKEKQFECEESKEYEIEM